MKRIQTLIVAFVVGVTMGTASASTERLASLFGQDSSTCGIEKSTVPGLCYFRCGSVFSAMCIVHTNKDGTTTECAGAAGSVVVDGDLCG